jgi:hypothetical protein
MPVEQFDILNAIDTRASRNYRCSTADEIADELRAATSEVVPEIAHMLQAGHVRVVREKEGDPCFALTEAGTIAVTDGLNEASK